MDKRLYETIEFIRQNDFYPATVKPEYDNLDLLMYDEQMSAKRLREYMLSQTVNTERHYRLCGLIKFDDNRIEGDIFRRIGTKRFTETKNCFYNNPIDNLCTFEWQHATANYPILLDLGIEGMKSEIASAKKRHTNAEKLRYLDALEYTCDSILMWADKVADSCLEAADKADSQSRRNEYIEIAERLRRVPRFPAQNFKDAMQSIYLCFDFLPDSIGTIDRTLAKYYFNDIENGTLTRDEAKDYIAEFFIKLCSFTPLTSKWAGDKGAESHFAIGGYLPDGSDGFNDLSHLIVETMMELPIPRPQVSLRITPKTPYEVVRYVLDCMRKDKYMRFAFVGDDLRIKGFTEIANLPYNTAITYTMVGCNEPAIPGSIWLGGCTSNIGRSLTNLLYNCRKEVLACESFESLYALYERELEKDISEIFRISDGFNIARSKDNNILSSLFIDGCIDSATAVNRGGGKIRMAGSNLMGITCVIDSLSIIKQLVFEEKYVSLQTLLDALDNNWKGYDELRSYIMKKGRFFGNNDELSDGVAKDFCNSLYNISKEKTNLYGIHFIYGSLAGYNPHYAFFGNRTKATPDGRFDGEPFMVGTGQSAGKDRNGLTSLLNSVKQMDVHGIFTGPIVVNAYVDEALIKDDDKFEKTCQLLYHYFITGGIHIQLNYVSKEDLLAARKNPGEYANLRVRVSGFSGNYVNLHEAIQDDILKRTEISQ